MRTNMVIDDGLMEEAMKASGLPTKQAVIEEALRTLIRLKSQEEIRICAANFSGKVTCQRCAQAASRAS